MAIGTMIRKTLLLTAVFLLGFTLLAPALPSGSPIPSGVIYAQEDGEEDEEDDPSCESEGGDMSWILCPILGAFDSALEWLDRTIQGLLVVPESYFENGDGLHQVWQRFRNIAYIILVPITLVMVIGTALNFDFISAYTVKRALPRLVIAAIFIALSWEIVTFLIDFFNAIGRGTIGLISIAFADSATISLSSLIHTNQAGGAAGGIGLLALVAGAGAGGALAFAAGSLSFTILLLYAAGAALILFMGWLVLVFRQVLIVFLAVLAPLAILAWIFPGNDRLWKLWWGTFSKLLMVFPLIVGLITIGKAFASIVDQADNGAGNEAALDEVALFFVKMTAYIAPYFFIPATFKFAGGIFATISGMVNDKQRGLLDRGRALRKSERERYMERADRGARWNEDSRIGKRFNRTALKARNIGQAGWNPKDWKSKLDQVASDKDIINARRLAEEEEFSTWKAYDNLTGDAMNSRNADDLREILQKSGRYKGPNRDANIERDVQRVERMRRKYGEKAFKIAMHEATAVGATVFDKGEGTQNVWKEAGKIADGDEAVLANIVGGLRGKLVNAGRIDEGGGNFGNTLDIAREGYTNPNVDEEVLRNRMHRLVYDQQGGAMLTHPAMKADAVRNLMPTVRDSLQRGIEAGNQGDSQRAAQEFAAFMGVYDGLANSSPEKQKIAQEMITGQEIDIASLGPEMRQMLHSALLEQQADGTVTERTTGTVTMSEAVRAARGNSQVQQYTRQWESDTASLHAAFSQQQAAQLAGQRPGQGPPGGVPPTGPRTGINP